MERWPEERPADAPARCEPAVLPATIVVLLDTVGAGAVVVAELPGGGAVPDGTYVVVGVAVVPAGVVTVEGAVVAVEPAADELVPGWTLADAGTGKVGTPLAGGSADAETAGDSRTRAPARASARRAVAGATVRAARRARRRRTARVGREDISAPMLVPEGGGRQQVLERGERLVQHPLGRLVGVDRAHALGL